MREGSRRSRMHEAGRCPWAGHDRVSASRTGCRCCSSLAVTCPALVVLSYRVATFALTFREPRRHQHTTSRGTAMTMTLRDKSQRSTSSRRGGHRVSPGSNPIVQNAVPTRRSPENPDPPEAVAAGHLDALDVDRSPCRRSARRLERRPAAPARAFVQERAWPSAAPTLPRWTRFATTAAPALDACSCPRKEARGRLGSTDRAPLGAWAPSLRPLVER